MSRNLLASTSATALGLGAAGWALRRAMRRQRVGRPLAGKAAASRDPPQPGDTGAITRAFLLYYVVPLWLASGVADWACHRASNIEGTTGAKESLLHLLMLAEVSLPVLAGLFLEITSPVLALMIASFLLHDATALWDVSYAVTLREVTPLEQHVHSFLEMVPLMAISFIGVLHWPQLRALFGFGSEAADWGIRLKEQPLPAGYVVADLGATIIFEVLPYLEELLRGLRAGGGRLVRAGPP